MELLQRQLQEKDVEIMKLKKSKLVYKRPIKQIIQEVRQCNVRERVYY